MDPVTVRFGPGAATDTSGQGHFDDVDGEGDVDVVLHFRTRDTGLVCGATSVALSGTTYSGEAIKGFDLVIAALLQSRGYRRALRESRPIRKAVL